MNEEDFEWESYEAQTMSLALAGDSRAGIEALRICAAGLCSDSLSEAMRFYLARCLLDVANGVKAGRALNVEVGRERGRPRSEDSSNRQMLLAVWIKLAVGRGIKLAAAKADAGDLWAVANVDRAIRGVEVAAVDDEPGLWDRIFQEMGKPLPPRQ